MAEIAFYLIQALAIACGTSSMKRTHSPEGGNKFSGNLRHYHRSNHSTTRWDDWVNGTPLQAKPNRNWLKITGITVSVLALAGIITGLVIELG